MAGILANSSSVTMSSGDTEVLKVVSGFARAERITLSTYPTGTDYFWALSLPSSSSDARAYLSSTSDPIVDFVPDAPGEFIVFCEVDGTPYQLVIEANDLAQTSIVSTVKFPALYDSAVATPLAGVCLYYSINRSAFCAKMPDDTIKELAWLV